MLLLSVREALRFRNDRQPDDTAAASSVILLYISPVIFTRRTLYNLAYFAGLMLPAANLTFVNGVSGQAGEYKERVDGDARRRTRGKLTVEKEYT